MDIADAEITASIWGMAKKIVGKNGQGAEIFCRVEENVFVLQSKMTNNC